MKIAIIGYSGSGKSTLAAKLGKFYHAEVLHLDSVHFLPGWVERNAGLRKRYGDKVVVLKNQKQTDAFWESILQGRA
jgi:Adenylate kinase and related kinases